MATLIVDRCRCSGQTFDEIRQVADRLDTTSIKRLKRELNMGAYCSACRPFLVEMFRSGQTRFEVETE
jgi:bacterioferritin-associated ferredoxin